MFNFIKKKFNEDNVTERYLNHKIEKIYYINLAYRVDRKAHIEKEIKKIDPELRKTQAIKAIEHEQAGIGCCLSHIKVLEDAIYHDYENIIVFEDDFYFSVKTGYFFDSIDYFFEKYPNYNLCMISRNLIRRKKLCKNVFEVLDAQTTSGLLINNRFYKQLKKTFEEAYKGLMSGNKSIDDGYYGVGNIYALDQYWKKLQGSNKKFYTFSKALGKQIPSYSDIEKKHMDYKC